MRYEEELGPLMDALAAAGYNDDTGSERELCLLRMRKQTGAGTILVLVCEEREINGGAGFPVHIRASCGEKTFKCDRRISPADASTDFDKLIAKLELLASD